MENSIKEYNKQHDQAYRQLKDDLELRFSQFVQINAFLGKENIDEKDYICFISPLVQEQINNDLIFKNKTKFYDILHREFEYCKNINNNCTIGWLIDYRYSYYNIHGYVDYKKRYVYIYYIKIWQSGEEKIALLNVQKCISEERYSLNTKIDKNVIQKILSLIENKENIFGKEEFPYYIGDNIIMEHFEVDSSKNDRRGSELRKKHIEYYKKVNKNKKRILSENIERKNNLCTGVLKCKSSYEEYISNFESSFNKHIHSLNKYIDSEKYCGIKIFLIEYRGGKIYFIDNKTSNKIDYELSYDKIICEYLSQYKEILNYIIFYNKHENKLEIIDMQVIEKDNNYNYSVKIDDVCKFTVLSKQNIKLDAN